MADIIDCFYERVLLYEGLSSLLLEVETLVLGVFVWPTFFFDGFPLGDRNATVVEGATGQYEHEAQDFSATPSTVVDKPVRRRLRLLGRRHRSALAQLTAGASTDTSSSELSVADVCSHWQRVKASPSSDRLQPFVGWLVPGLLFPSFVSSVPLNGRSTPAYAFPLCAQGQESPRAKFDFMNASLSEVKITVMMALHYS
jgi:hypothetical protein